MVRVLPGFGRNVRRGEATAVQVLIEGTNSNTASIVSNYAAQIVSGYARDALEESQRDRLVTRTLETGASVPLKTPGLTTRSRVWFNPELRSRDYFVPGVVVNIITIITLMLTAMAIVREKEMGTLEQLMVTPIRPIELMLGKTPPFALVGLVEVILVTATAVVVFHIPFRGSALTLLVFGVGIVLVSALRFHQRLD